MSTGLKKLVKVYGKLVNLQGKQLYYFAAFLSQWGSTLK